MKALSETLPSLHAAARSTTDTPEQRKERKRLPLLTELLREQSDLSAVERFSQRHDDSTRPLMEPVYRDLLPASPPRPGEQYAFEVDLDACTGCKACVAGCHSMNGLDEDETWRAVGTLRGTESAALRTVTTACHHCVDPGCMNGCPVNAYEKDPVTGIVRHLDDQCIGCQYCTFTCPYEVPQYNQRLGIVRKCDMCSDRLGAGEAPACVQSCPNGAISIRIVEQESAQRSAEAGVFLPTTPDPRITKPTTRYRSRSETQERLVAADGHALRPAHDHAPLVAMLVMTQMAVGALLVQGFLGSQLSLPVHAMTAAFAHLIVNAGVVAATLHLGRPMYAFRAILNVRRSWMSREVLMLATLQTVSGAHALIAIAAAGWLPFDLPFELLTPADAQGLLLYSTSLTASCGLLAVFSSMMLYHVTGRAYWHASRTTPRFLLTTMLLGLAASVAIALTLRAAGAVAASPEAFVPAALLLVVGLTAAKLWWEETLSYRGDGILLRTAALLQGPLAGTRARRRLCAVAGGMVLTLGGLVAELAEAQTTAAAAAVLALGVLIAGELYERGLFFTAMASPKMPGDTP